MNIILELVCEFEDHDVILKKQFAAFIEIFGWQVIGDINKMLGNTNVFWRYNNLKLGYIK